MSPPHTPPPLPPELVRESEVNSRATTETETTATTTTTTTTTTIVRDDVTGLSGKEELEDLGLTCLRCGLPLPSIDTGELMVACREANAERTAALPQQMA